jgi:hypothetical protein
MEPCFEIASAGRVSAEFVLEGRVLDQAARAVSKRRTRLRPALVSESRMKTFATQHDTALTSARQKKEQPTFNMFWPEVPDRG